MFILGGSASNGLDASVARLLNAKFGRVSVTNFPDGEMRVRMPDGYDGGDVVIVQSTYPPQDRNLFELILMADYFREVERSITAVVPYLGYARQDKSFIAGEAVSINTVLNMMAKAGVKNLITVNPHKIDSLKHFDGGVAVVNAVHSLTGLVKTELKKPLVMAPDIGGLELAKKAASEIGCEYTYIEKKRDNSGNVSIVKTHGGDFEGKDVVIFDDIISTGGTIDLAARFAYGEGAKTVSAAAVHLVMAQGAHERMAKAKVTRIFGTNTIPCAGAQVIDISAEIASSVEELLKGLHQGKL